MGSEMCIRDRLGACLGLESWPAAMIDKVKAVNDLELEPLVQGLLALR